MQIKLSPGRASNVQELEKKKKKKGGLAFPFKMKQFPKPLRIWPQGSGGKRAGGAGEAAMTEWKRDNKKTEVRRFCLRWFFYARFRKKKMRTESRQCFNDELTRALTRFKACSHTNGAWGDHTKPKTKQNKKNKLCRSALKTRHKTGHASSIPPGISLPSSLPLSLFLHCHQIGTHGTKDHLVTMVTGIECPSARFLAKHSLSFIGQGCKFPSVLR